MNYLLPALLGAMLGIVRAFSNKDPKAKGRYRFSRDELARRSRLSSEIKRKFVAQGNSSTIPDPKKVDWKKHVNDVRIGADEWLPVAELPPDFQRKAVEIDPIILTVTPLWDALETSCEVECCGIHAFGFYPEEIAEAAKQVDVRETLSRLRIMEEALRELHAEVFESTRLSEYLEREAFLKLLRHIAVNLEQAEASFIAGE